MFTGIIQTVGHIDSVKAVGDDVQLTIEAAKLKLKTVAIGDSIAVNGICLTVTEKTDTHFFVHVSEASLNITIGLDKAGDVNLEKALQLNDHLGGHLVSGHVDGTGEVVYFEAVGDCWLLKIKAPHAISKYIAKKGSICVDGVSLTVNEVDQDTFAVNIIPHTIEHTVIQYYKTGHQVNLEVDQVARYVERLNKWSQQKESN